MNWKKAVIWAFFALLLATPMLLRQADRGWSGAESPVSGDERERREQALARHGVHYTEISETAGVAFTHQRCSVAPELAHIAPQIAAMGASVSVADVDRDGRLDFYLTNSAFGEPNHLYLQLPDGRFREAAAEYGVADLNRPGEGASMGSVWADVDNDGFEDLLVYRYGRPALFMNREGRRFEPFDGPAEFPEWINSNSAVWLDYDADGYVDLFLTGYFHEEVDIWELSTTRIMPDSYEYATNGGRNVLLRNVEGRAFVDVTRQTGLDTRLWTLAATAVDVDGSGYPDLVLANDYGVDELFLNVGGAFFVPAGEASGIGFIPKSGMSVTAADFYNQGAYALYITNISEAGVLMQGNNLWVETGREPIDPDLVRRAAERIGRGEGVGAAGQAGSWTEAAARVQVPRYLNAATDAGVEIGLWGYAGAAADVDNNGFQDLYVANGFYSATPETDYWYDYAKVVGANRNVIIDAVNWPAMEERTFSGYQANRLWLNDGAGRFREVSEAVGAGLTLDSRSAAFADVFEDGALDLLVASQHAPFRLYRGETAPGRAWIALELEGRVSNRSAIGATATIWWTMADGTPQRQIRHVSGGEAFSSQSSRRLHVGLGNMGPLDAADPPRVDSVRISWPSGIRQTLRSLPAGRLHKVVEPVSGDDATGGRPANSPSASAANTAASQAAESSSKPTLP